MVSDVGYVTVLDQAVFGMWTLMMNSSHVEFVPMGQWMGFPGWLFGFMQTPQTVILKLLLDISVQKLRKEGGGLHPEFIQTWRQRMVQWKTFKDP